MGIRSVILRALYKVYYRESREVNRQERLAQLRAQVASGYCRLHSMDRGKLKLEIWHFYGEVDKRDVQLGTTRLASS